ncbi:MAG: DUF4062 domain-containing protein [Acidobacteriota bacterium]
MKKVFLSSVAIGLETFRDAAFAAINGLDGYHCVRMEDFGARTVSPAEFCVQAVKSCDIFIGIIGQRYGSCAPESSMSFTELEYRAATEANIPRLMAVAPDDQLVPAHHREPDDKHQKLQRFRNEVLSLSTAAFFRSEESLALEVLKALQNERQRAANTQHAEPLSRNEARMAERPTVEMLSDNPDPEKTYLLFPFVTNAPALGLTSIPVSLSLIPGVTRLGLSENEAHALFTTTPPWPGTDLSLRHQPPYRQARV